MSIFGALLRRRSPNCTTSVETTKLHQLIGLEEEPIFQSVLTAELFKSGIYKPRRWCANLRDTRVESAPFPGAPTFSALAQRIDQFTTTTCAVARIALLSSWVINRKSVVSSGVRMTRSWLLVAMTTSFLSGPFTHRQVPNPSGAS